MTGKENLRERRSSDPYLDRRSGEERRKAYHLDYFSHGGTERRAEGDRRSSKERRKDCVKVSRWSSVCPNGANAPLTAEDPAGS